MTARIFFFEKFVVVVFFFAWFDADRCPMAKGGPYTQTTKLTSQ